MPTKTRLNRPLVWAVVIFIICLSIGYALSLRRPLWNDEIHSQVTVVDSKSYLEIFLGQIYKLESNNFPLFYLIQKAISDCFQYKFPIRWNEEWMISEEKSQVVLRLSPNFFMSLSIALIFYFFTQCYSVRAGIYALFLTLSSYMVWAYWVEARPYALWFFLTTSQAVMFLLLIRDQKNKQVLWTVLTIVHVLLSLTLVLSVIQILTVSFLLWLYCERSWKKYLLTTAFPLGICFLYYAKSILRNYSLEHPLSLIFRNVPPEQLAIIAVYFSFLTFCRWRGKGGQFANSCGAISLEGRRCALLFLLFGGAALLLLWKMGLTSTPGLFSLSERYFIYLVPVGIIATTVFAIDFISMSHRRPWVLANIVIALSGFLIMRSLRTYIDIFGF